MTKTFVKSLMLTAALLITAMTGIKAQIKVHSIGDSTMQTYDESSTDKRGWAQMLQQFFNAEFVTVNNRGKSGASSKSFY
ncbi:MAG: carbohydrate esterase, partial [Bacteroidaceae bacterium]|nr:carbohydrate esterase [Bacteroidaceae bacterium]